MAKVERRQGDVTMFRMGRTHAPETGAGGAPVAPAPDSKGGTARRRFTLFSIGLQVAALVVVGVFLIAGLALIGESRLAAVSESALQERQVLESDRTNVTQTLTALQRAAAASAGHLAAFGRAGDAIVAGRQTSAAADLAERALTDFAQSLQQLDASNRSFAVAAAKSAQMRPWDESINNDQEAAYIKAERERIQAMLKITQDLPAALAGVVLDNQEMTAAARSGNVADARELYLTRQSPKLIGLVQSVQNLQTATIDFGIEFAGRHSSLMRATEADAQDRYDGLRSSFRLQIFLLMMVLCAGGALIAIYGLAIPLADLTASAARFAEGRFEVPTTVLGRRDEIGRLSRALERIRETVTNEKQVVAAQGREEREAKEAERLERNTMEREIQALRKDRERLETELADREATAQVQPQITPEAVEAERAKVRAEMQAQAKEEMDRAAAEIARLQGELDKKPAADPSQREALTKAETEIARLKIQVERQNSNAVAEGKKHQDAIAQAQGEVARLIDEVHKLRTAVPAGGADAEALVKAEAEIARLQKQVEQQGASNVAREKRHQESMDRAQAEIDRLSGELNQLRNAPPQPSSAQTAGGADKATRDALNQARNEIARLKNEQVRERNVARKAASEIEARAAQVAADAQAERERLNRVAAEATQAATAAQDELRRIGSALALAQQTREDDLAEARAAHARQMAELQNRLAEQQADRVQVINELINGFETSIANAVAAVQSASHEVAVVSGQMGEAAQRAGQQRGEISTRVGRASASIQTASNAAQQIATAFDELTQQLGQSVSAASGATASARIVNDAVSALEAAAGRISEAGTVVNDLAERTNVLSLNASIEAAKAGDAGKGFVVVAAEIKSLANRTVRTGKELSDRIKAVASAAHSVRSAFAGVNTALGELDSLAAKTARAAAQQGTSARSIASGVHAAAEGTESINRVVTETTSSLDSSSSAVSQAQAAARTLDQQAQELRRQIDEFLTAIRSA
jgi:methyl-accepting chemotaxis protein/HAMP domain-containing protein